jgi:hypothetical protein
VYQATPQLPLQCVIAGRYHDVLEKVDGAWRFRDRYIIGDLLGDLSQHLRDNPLEETLSKIPGGRLVRSRGAFLSPAGPEVSR